MGRNESEDLPLPHIDYAPTGLWARVYAMNDNRNVFCPHQLIHKRIIHNRLLTHAPACATYRSGGSYVL